MSNHFLCPNHRQWLSQNPGAAISNLATTQETATYYRERGMFEQALMFAGNAFETAEIILTAKIENTETAILALTSSAILLAENYRRLNKKTQSKQVLLLTQQRLQAEHCLLYQDDAAQQSVVNCIKSLTLAEQTHQLLESNQFVQTHHTQLH